MVIAGCNNDETIQKVIRHLILIIDGFYKDRDVIKVIDKKLVLGGKEVELTNVEQADPK